MFSSAYCAVGPKYATVPSVPNAASMSVVAASPVGWLPTSVPTSTPSLAGSCTSTAASSNTGWSNSSRITSLPTTPVPQTMTGYLSLMRKTLLR
ncbi:Uncharacterised protein [Mycobacteroides abscessus subsp. massiliense]|nr:Uncharacterised protein [Mycobacteroides abscessus subsp. massiliense]